MAAAASGLHVSQRPEQEQAAKAADYQQAARELGRGPGVQAGVRLSPRPPLAAPQGNGPRNRQAKRQSEGRNPVAVKRGPRRFPLPRPPLGV